MMVTDQRLAREREAMARAPKQHLDPADTTIDAASMGAEDAHYTELMVQKQWMIGYKLFLDREGNEYGIPYPVPIGQWSNGANALVNMKRLDGGYAWTAIRPERLQPAGTIECIEDTCGDGHVGGRRKRLHTVSGLIEHVEVFHPRAAKTYAKYLEEIADQLAIDNPRLQALRKSGATVEAQAIAPVIFYCEDDDCTRFFDTEAGLRMHKTRDHREG